MLYSALIAGLLLWTAGRQDNPAPAERGALVYRSQCARCHGVNAEGYRGPDLTTGRWKHGSSDAALFKVIRAGIPGTEMNASTLPDTGINDLIAYLRTLAGPARIDRGNPQNGMTVFFGKAACSRCHRVSGRGGRLGPDLTFAALTRSKAALVREIRRPGEVVPQGYEMVVVVTKQGEEIAGLRKNEDPFSIQMLDLKGDLRAFMKSDLRSVRSEDISLMPDYGPDKLSDSELDDILRFLAETAMPRGDRQ